MKVPLDHSFSLSGWLGNTALGSALDQKRKFEAIGFVV